MQGHHVSISDALVSKHCTFAVLMALTFLEAEPDPKSSIPTPQGPCSLCAWGPGESKRTLEVWPSCPLTSLMVTATEVTVKSRTGREPSEHVPRLTSW